MSTSGAGSGSNMEVLDQPGYAGYGSANHPSRRCAACKYLRRRCAPDCVLAPYFPASQPRRYANVHAVFGTSNVTRLLQSLPVQERGPAADTMAAEAQWRVQDPVYGSAGIIDQMHQEIRAAQHELARTRAELAMQMRRQAPLQGAQPPPSTTLPPPTVATAAAMHSTSVHLLAVQHEEEEAPLMDPDEFLDLDDL